MDKQLIEATLESIRRCIERIEQTRPKTIAELTANPDQQDILVLNLSSAVQLCVDIASHLISESELQMPSTMGESFNRLEALGVIDLQLSVTLRNAVGFRNIAVLNYQAIDWAIVFSICSKDLRNFKDFSKAIAEHCHL